MGHVTNPGRYAVGSFNCRHRRGIIVVDHAFRKHMNARSQDSQTVTITTKNTAALTLGIIAVVVGVLSLLVGWIPFLGLLAIPTAIIGFLLAGIGVVIALFKGAKGIGMPLLGGVICVAALLLPIFSTGGTTAAISEAIDETSAQMQALEQERKEAETKADTAEIEEKATYIQNHIVLYDVGAKYWDSVLNGKVPGVLFKLRNTGERQLGMVEVTVFFKDKTGAVIFEEDFHPVLVSEYSFGDSKPLKPGYVWQMESGKFYAAKSVPQEWEEGAVEAKITDIRFSE